MIKEIKFRGFSLESGWLYGYYVKGSTRHCILPNLGGMQFDVEQETIGQFTGLRDKAGREIYEGDFVNCNRYESGDDYLVEIKDIRFLPSELYGSNLNYREVVGNTFENANLFKETN